MGACTSAARYRKKHHPQLHKAAPAKNSHRLDNKQQVTFSPVTILSKPQSQRPQSLFTNLDLQSSTFIETTLYKTDTNSLIQLYSSNYNNNNNSNRNSWMSSSSSSKSHPQPRIPVPKTRLPVYQATTTTAVPLRPKNGLTIGTPRPMSASNRSSLPSPSQSGTQPRLGSIPRPIAPGLQPAQAALLEARSRSISPSSTNGTKSTPTQHVTKTQTTPNRFHTTITSKSKVVPSSSNRVQKDSPSTTATADRQRINTSSRPSNISSLIPSAQAIKADVNVIRDRYKAPKRMNFFTRRTPISNALKASPIEPTVIEEEKNEQSSADEHTASFPVESQNDDLTTDSVHHGDSAYASTESPTNRPTSAQRSQASRYRHRTPSTLSSSSALSNVLNQEGLLDDDNCSLKSDDLICDYDDTLTLDSISKTNRTDSISSTSLSLDINKNSSSTTKVYASAMQPSFKDNRPANNVRESLDELNRLSHRMDSVFEQDPHRLTRSISLKPPSTTLPPREDAEQITMDIESYRQVMKDVMVVKTILHQLDRLLKHSDGANMTDSMIGSFHDSMISSRHQSLSGMACENHIRTNSVDENSSYEDLVKELLTLRKEREQDKQTIKLLQEQMYKYSSQANSS
ncbi:unnamed protein product [Adineta ricciae]|uniref:Uncharacterized protein n=2 Tax=Adineta ricciae TaxID=249248 RepID=A0A813ZYT5_ADIRI|nr:unnamed protein product [Adineta ricciae]